MIKLGKFAQLNMPRQAIGSLVLALLCFPVANAQVSTSATRGGASVSNTVPKPSMVVPDAQVTPEAPLPAGAVVIYSNLGTGSTIYNAGTGWTEAGLEANDYPLAEAMSFIPSADYVLVRIDAAFTYVTGTNGAKLVLAADNNGIPGNIIYHNTFSNLPDFGTCCVLQTAKLTPTKSNHITLHAGQRYWLYPLPADTTSYLVWNYDTTNTGGSGAVSKDYGKTWTPATYDTFGAFDVYGIATSR